MYLPAMVAYFDLPLFPYSMRLIYVDIQHNYVEMQHTLSRSHVNIIIFHVDIDKSQFIYVAC